MPNSFEEDADLLREYAQFRAVNKNKGDTSPEAFLIARAQAEAHRKLDEVRDWYAVNVVRSAPNWAELEVILG